MDDPAFSAIDLAPPIARAPMSGDICMNTQARAAVLGAILNCCISRFANHSQNIRIVL